MTVSAGSVSYTHLDVYKRQEDNMVVVSLAFNIGFDALCKVFNADGIRPVSYTHLDVYKRQVPY